MMAARVESLPNVIWEPQPGSQVAFLTCPYPEVLYEGTRGPGKTDALLMDFAQHVGQGFGQAWRGILFRQTYPQLADVIAKSRKWFPQIWPGAKFNGGNSTWTFPDGEQLLLRQFRREDDYWNYHGHEYPWVAWEELCTWANDAGYKRMMSTNRSSHPGVPRKYRATTNPYGPGHNWVKARFRLPGARFRPIRDAVDMDGRPEPVRVAIHGRIDENKVILAADPGYIQRIAASARNEAERAAWLDGSWDIVAGGMFDDVWSAAHNRVRPFSIPHNWRIDRSFDWGDARPFSVGWWAESDGSDWVDADGNLRASVPGDMFRIREWYGWNGRPNEGCHMLARDIAKGIVEREIAWGIHSRVQPGPADSSIYTVENGSCVASDMDQPVRVGNRVYGGVRWTRADKSPGSRENGWQAMRTMMSDAHPRPDGYPREHPGLFVVAGHCEHFERTVPVLPRSDRNLEDVNTDAEDHIGDETRYRVRKSAIKIRQARTTGWH